MDSNDSTSSFSSRPVSSSDTEVRAYKYNPRDVQELFTKIIEALSLPHETEGVVERILTDVCRHFKFGCGFVYEADHTQTFHLKEHYAAFDANELPERLQLEAHMGEEDIARLLHTSVFFQRETTAPLRATTRIFESNTLMLVPAQNKDGVAIGLVGMMDRRRNILMDEHAVNAAKTVLNLLANNIKLRIYQRNLEYAQQSLHNVLDNTGVDIYVNDFHTHEILYVNQSMATPYGGFENLIGKKCWEALYTGKTEQCDYCPQKKLIDEDGNPTKIYSWDYRRPFDGSWFRVLSAAFRWVDGRLAHVVSSVDITENKSYEATIAQMANFDSLTNLPNRRKLMHDCAECMKTAVAGSRSGGYLLFFDLDNFKALNDSVGHQGGDELLAEVGRVLQKEPLTKNHSYRYGGDEFIVLLAETDRDYVMRVVRFLLERFEQPWRLTNAQPICRASIGVAAFPEDAATPDELLHRADTMMYKAKQNGRGMACFYDGSTFKPGDELPGR